MSTVARRRPPDPANPHDRIDRVLVAITVLLWLVAGVLIAVFLSLVVPR